MSSCIAIEDLDVTPEQSPATQVRAQTQTLCSEAAGGPDPPPCHSAGLVGVNLAMFTGTWFRGTNGCYVCVLRAVAICKTCFGCDCLCFSHLALPLVFINDLLQFCERPLTYENTGKTGIRTVSNKLVPLSPTLTIIFALPRRWFRISSFNSWPEKRLVQIPIHHINPLMNGIFIFSISMIHGRFSDIRFDDQAHFGKING